MIHCGWKGLYDRIGFRVRNGKRVKRYYDLMVGKGGFLFSQMFLLLFRKLLPTRFFYKLHIESSCADESQFFFFFFFLLVKQFGEKYSSGAKKELRVH